MLIEKVASIVPDAVQVGGSVRDLYIGRQPKDIDFATAYTPDEVEAFIKSAGLKAYGIGKRFGTVGCRIDGIDVEITTFRTERYTAGSRKPEVEFITDLHGDLARRDFTMNAMALTPDGTIIDPFNGREAIDQKSIVAVGKAEERFAEDPLRMLRAARFAAQLDYRIAPKTLYAMGGMSRNILTVSKERWVQEFDKLLMGNPDQGLQPLVSTGLLMLMLPEILYSRYRPIVGTLNERWSLFLSDNRLYNIISREPLFRKDCVRKIAGHLKFSKERTTFLLEHA